MTPENQGLTILKPADKHLALTSNRKTIPLDDSHKAQIEALMRSGFTTLWIADHHLLQSHTKALQNLLDGPEGKEFNLVGIFKTNSRGTDPGTPNCFLIPLRDGAWQVYRFSLGVVEADTWTQDGQSWTTCYFNRCHDLNTACTHFGGVEREQGGYAFASADDAIKAARSLGQELKLKGVSGMPRHWEVKLSTPHDARAEKKAGTTRQKLLNAASQFPEGETKTGIFTRAGVKSTHASRNVFDALVSERVFVPHEVLKSGAKHRGYRLSPEALTACKGLA
jgi:hypothetical protein